MNNCVKLTMLEVSNFYLFHQPICISLEMDTGCRPSQPPPTPYCIQFSANLWWDQAFIVHIVYSPLQTYSVYILYIVLGKPMVASGLQCSYCIQSFANLFSVHTVYSPLQTYGGIRPSVCILYCMQSSANLCWYHALSVSSTTTHKSLHIYMNFVEFIFHCICLNAY